MVIKPSGIGYDDMTVDDMVVVDLDGNVVAGERRPSTDTPTHLVLYRAFDEIGAVMHTHSTWGVAWAQAQCEIPVLGTTHADLCAYPIPVTRALTGEEIAFGYEEATGTTLVEVISELGTARAAVRARPWTRPVLLGADTREGGRGRGHARGGGANGPADHLARAERAAAPARSARQAPRAQARTAGVLRAALIFASVRPHG